jgi:FtsP/CotA-like multicopper oxidase with cupredoxin domain
VGHPLARPTNRLNRRELLGLLGAAALPAGLSPDLARGQNVCPAGTAIEKADFTLHIGPVTVEIAPKKTFKTTGYNGTAPGPLLRVREGKPINIDVHNDTGVADLVHWHGLHIPADVDGSMEEGTPMIAAHSCRRYRFTPTPSGTRWYHSHGMAGRNLNRATYTGQFGFMYIEPASEAGAYDQEIFLALHEWDPFLSTMGGDDSLDVAYKMFSINGHALGSGDPIRVREGQRVMLRILNASATMHRRIGFAGHTFQVIAMDGNAVPSPRAVEALELGPAERIDAVVEMNRPGVWILGAAEDHDREAGMGIVVEYGGQSGPPQWIAPEGKWDYTMFGPAGNEPELESERIPLVIEKKFVGHRWVDNWTINGKSFPKTDPIMVRANGRYRLLLDNRSDEAHPVHLHRHTFELKKIAGVATSGVRKDVVVLPAKSVVEVELVANNPGLTLFHCHQQMHMDYGFMALMKYA